MDIKQATENYEAWLAHRLPLIPADLKLKHERMAESAFSFLRATFYRWAQIWPEVCGELASAPGVLGVGDLHVENFGTWRDSEARLIWGINDFDEAGSLPYTNDLVRLAVSARLAFDQNNLPADVDAAADAILEGYRTGLARRGGALVLEEQHRWLRTLAMNDLRDPTAYWDKLNGLPTLRRGIPAAAQSALKSAMPEAGISFRVAHRQAGLGSLGRRRFTALAEWRGGFIAREAKELTVSAWHWWQQKPGEDILYPVILKRAIRALDPCVSLRRQWLLRRLAPHCSRIELDSLPKARDERKLLHAMGWETANIHLGTPGAAHKVEADLRKRPPHWLRKATGAMTKATLADWKAWCAA